MSGPMRRHGTRPTNIIISTTTKAMAAVERFSGTMSAQMTAVKPRIHLKPSDVAPSSSRITLSSHATTTTSDPLAISDGWKETPKKLTKRWVSLTAP